MSCKHLCFRDGTRISVPYKVIRMCDGENRLKTRSGHAFLLGRKSGFFGANMV